MILEEQTSEPLMMNTSPDLRVSTINVASEKILRRFDVWTDIISLCASCYYSIEVWDKDSSGYITFDNKTLGYDYLGYVIENSVIRTALWEKVQRYDDITVVIAKQLKLVIWGESEVFFTFEDGVLLTAKLVVGTNSANKSWLRGKAEIPLTFWDYHHHELIAIIRTTKPHDGVVRHTFHDDSTLAFLPLSDSHLCSVVWSLAPDSARQMYEAEPEFFNRALCVAFDNRLGLCSLLNKCQVFPLIGSYARQFAAHRLVLIGDAAYSIHHLAGLEINLGLMDASELVKELRRIYYEGKDIGLYLYLRRYERRRKYSAVLTLSKMQCFYELFVGSHPSKKLFRGLCLKFANTFPDVKLLLLRQIMGLGN